MQLKTILYSAAASALLWGGMALSLGSGREKPRPEADDVHVHKVFEKGDPKKNSPKDRFLEIAYGIKKAPLAFQFGSYETSCKNVEGNF